MPAYVGAAATLQLEQTMNADDVAVINVGPADLPAGDPSDVILFFVLERTRFGINLWTFDTPSVTAWLPFASGTGYAQVNNTRDPGSDTTRRSRVLAIRRSTFGAGTNFVWQAPSGVAPSTGWFSVTPIAVSAANALAQGVAEATNSFATAFQAVTAAGIYTSQIAAPTLHIASVDVSLLAAPISLDTANGFTLQVTREFGDTKQHGLAIATNEEPAGTDPVELPRFAIGASVPHWVVHGVTLYELRRGRRGLGLVRG